MLVVGPEWLSGRHVQGYGPTEGCIIQYGQYAEGKAFLGRITLACNKACLWWPGIVPFTTAKAAR
jgi:hypothetical protein